MTFNVQTASLILQLSKSKVPRSLRERVVSRQMLLFISKTTPITFLCSICPTVSSKQIKMLLDTNPNSKQELQYYRSNDKRHSYSLN